MKRILWILAALTSSACSGSDTDLETAFCEALDQAAVRTVTATATASGAPDVTDVARVDIQLTSVSGLSGGFVSYTPDEVGSFAFGLTDDVTFVIRDGGGTLVPLDRSVTGSTVCDALAVRHTAALTVQTYVIELGTTSTGVIGIVAEESDDDQ